MSEDPKIQQLLNAMKTVPEKLAAKWIQVTDATNARIAEFEKDFAAKEKELADLVKKYADKEQIISDLKAKHDKIMADLTSNISIVKAKDEEIAKLKEELKKCKEQSIDGNVDNNEILKAINEFIHNIKVITEKSTESNEAKLVISEVKPTNTEKTVISDPVEAKEPAKATKKKTAEKKEETKTPMPDYENMTPEETVDSVLAELGLTDL